jgi:Lrp/AsnC family leucine-responsive transcriptional regulator
MVFAARARQSPARPVHVMLPTLQSVQECHYLIGGDAFLLKVMLTSMAELESLIENLLPYGSPTTSMLLSTPLEKKPALALLRNL